MKTPPGTEVRLGLVADLGGYFVFLAAPPLTAGTHLLDQVGRPGALTALLTHDDGMHWTDREGVALAEATLAAGGSVVMQFTTVMDALAAHARLVREVAN